MKYKSFEEMPVWIDSIKLAKNIYKVTDQKSWVREYTLKDQMKRSAISISSNIAEGFETGGISGYTRYLRIAKGSAGELRSQLYLALELDFIDKSCFENMNVALQSISKQLMGLIKYIRNTKEV